MSEYHETTVVYAPSADALIDDFLVGAGFGVNPDFLRRKCRAEVLRLNAKSDSDLWSLGLVRRQIPAHVLRHDLPGLAPPTWP